MRTWDVRELSDPGAGPLKNHVGFHPRIQQRILELHPDAVRTMVGEVFECLRRARAERQREITLSFQCRSGRHRSVACAEMVSAYLAGQGYDASSRHADLERDPSKQCRTGCQLCQGPPMDRIMRLLSRVLEGV